MRAVVLALAVSVGLLCAQQASTDKGKDKGKTDEKSKQQAPPPEDSLFKNKAGYRSSKQSKESVTLGFNGVDPSGKVDKTMMARVPTATDTAAVAKMTANRPSADEVRTFVNQGGLK